MKQLLTQREQRIQELLDALVLLKRQRFAPRSERVSADQLGLFNEAELEARIGALEQAAAAPPPLACQGSKGLVCLPGSSNPSVSHGNAQGLLDLRGHRAIDSGLLGQIRQVGPLLGRVHLHREQ